MGVLSWFDGKFYAPLASTGNAPQLGQFAWVAVPQLQDHPYVIEGQRVDARNHAVAKARFTKMTDRHFTRRDYKDLPILNFGLGETEELLAYKAKRRLAVIVGLNGTVLGGAGKLPAHHEEERVVVAPVYDIATEDDPKGFTPLMAQRVRHLFYKQYFPVAEWRETRSPGADRSVCSVRPGILRFDRLQFVHRSPPGCRLVPLAIAPQPFALLHSMLWSYLHMPLSAEFEELRSLFQSCAPDGLVPKSG